MRLILRARSKLLTEDHTKIIKILYESHLGLYYQIKVVAKFDI